MERVLQVVGGMNRAGAETFLMNVYREIDKTQIQFDFLVYSNEKQDYEDEILSLGGRVIRIPYKAGIKGIFSISKIKKVIKEYGPYIAVHAHTLHNCAYSMIATKKYPNVLRISHSHSTVNTVKRNYIKKIYEKWTFKKIRKLSNKWLSCGQEAGVYLFGEEFNEKGVVINNGISPEKYFYVDSENYSRLKRDFDLENQLVIGHIGRFAPVKNHEFIIKIAKELKDKNVPFKMLLIGRGELENEIANEIKKQNLDKNVLLLGVREDIANLLKVMDVFLMPSIFEGNPVTLIEAQASGLPCLISSVITDKIDLNLGLIHKKSLNDSAVDWANELINLKGKRNEDFSLIKNAFIKSGYDVESVVRLLLKIYKDEI